MPNKRVKILQFSLFKCNLLITFSFGNKNNISKTHLLESTCPMPFWFLPVVVILYNSVHHSSYQHRVRSSTTGLSRCFLLLLIPFRFCPEASGRAGG